MRLKVSIVTVAYNQQEYIERCIKSIVSQSTEFKFELIIADDCSTDDTRKIIEKYTAQYPDIIKPIYRKSNIGSWNNFRDALSHVSGEYVALCDGDDYWCDDLKLDSQIKFLDDRPDYALCFHPVKVHFQNNEEEDVIYPFRKKNFTTASLLEENFIQTNSVMYRSQDYTRLPDRIMPGDWYLHLYHAQFGKIGFIDKVMSIYVRHEGGIWWDAYRNFDKIWMKYSFDYVNVYSELIKMFGGDSRNRKIIEDKVAWILSSIIDVDQKNKTNLRFEILTTFPEIVNIYLVRERLAHLNTLSDLAQLKILNTETNSKNETMLADVDRLRDLNRKITNDLNLIKSSRFWKVRNRMMSIINR